MGKFCPYTCLCTFDKKRYHGRFDSQLKVNGMTVLPVEVEPVLALLPDVSQAVIGKANNQLFAAIVLKVNTYYINKLINKEKTHFLILLLRWHHCNMNESCYASPETTKITKNGFVTHHSARFFSAFVLRTRFSFRSR